jgi:hypothetical protein
MRLGSIFAAHLRKNVISKVIDSCQPIFTLALGCSVARPLYPLAVPTTSNRKEGLGTVQSFGLGLFLLSTITYLSYNIPLN